MQEKTLLKIAGRVRPLSPAANLRRMAYEEGGGFYDAWRIADGPETYLLKAAGENELTVYRRLGNRLDALPRCCGTTTYRNKTYILLEFVEGRDLMRCTRADLVRVLDAMIALQDAYWDTKMRLGCSVSRTLPRLRKRRAYLNEPELRAVYDRFLALYPTLHRTLCHDDLLPFNLIVSGERAVFIDWEEAGVLPYPAMLSRLLAHGTEHGETPFFMTAADKAFALEYYYDRFIASKGVPRPDYDRAMALFRFFELTEWVYVYRKYGRKPDALFEYYYKELLEARTLFRPGVILSAAKDL